MRPREIALPLLTVLVVLCLCCPGAGARADTMPDHRLQQMRIENDGAYFHLIIPLSVPFADFSLDSPPRIILDLDQTTSCMPKAPGLYQVKLDRGPVVSLRTSQYQYSPLDHRVRIALELSSVLPYEVRRVQEGIDLRVPDPVTRRPRALRLGSTGLAAMGDEAAGDSVKPPGQPARAGMQLGPPEPKPEAEENSPAAQFRSLKEALAAAVGEINVQALDPDRPDEPQRALSSGSEAVPPRDLGGETGAATPPAAAPVLEYPKAAHPKAAPGQAGLPKSAPPKTAPPKAEPLEAADPAPVSTPALDQAHYIVPGDPRETGAGRLLRKANGALLQGDESKAQAAVERVLRFYPATPSGEQARIILRELLVLQGKDLEADQLGVPATAPDTTRIPKGVFLHLVHRYEGRSEPMEVDRLLREWGPAYGPVAALSPLHLALGEAFLRARRNDLARIHLELIPAGDANEPRALALLAQVEEASGSKEKALELFRHLSGMAAGPYQQRALVRAADLEFQLGRVQEALDSYTKLLDDKPPADEEPWALYQAANCLALLGDPGQAKLRYETVVGRWPQSYWAPFAQAQLEEMKWRTDLSSK